MGAGKINFTIITILGLAKRLKPDTIIETHSEEGRQLHYSYLDRPQDRDRNRQRIIERSLVMAYAYTNSRGRTYYLHSRTTMLKSGKEQTIYFFAKEVKDGSLEAVPAGYVVSESKNGLPVLKKG
jgi:hypothetical protein